MKAIQFLLAGILFLTTANKADAQVKDWLKQKKEEAKQKANAKIDQKASEGIDKAVNAPETAVKKKAKKKKNKKATATEQENTEQAQSETPPNTGEFIIATNIVCAAGKSQMEALLRDTDGVNSASIDSGSGKIYLSAGGNKEVYEAVIEIIRKNGFTADGKKPTVKANTCK
ncbi:hypothetical protein [Ferruginibacter sp.]|nr:hypothetical protein [Ferruginibacter sp.]